MRLVLVGEQSATRSCPPLPLRCTSSGLVRRRCRDGRRGKRVILLVSREMNPGLALLVGGFRWNQADFSSGGDGIP